MRSLLPLTLAPAAADRSRMARRVARDALVIPFPVGRRLDGESGHEADLAGVRRLPVITLQRVAAPADLFFEAFVATAGEVERRSHAHRVIQVRRRAFWHRYSTIELVRIEPDRVRSRWLTGPLPFVEESLQCVQVSPGETEIHYRAAFEPGDGIWPRLRAPFVPLLLHRDLRRRVIAAKRMAEGTFARTLAHESGHPSAMGSRRLPSRGATRRLHIVHSGGPDRPGSAQPS